MFSNQRLVADFVRKRQPRAISAPSPSERRRRHFPIVVIRYVDVRMYRKDKDVDTQNPAAAGDGHVVDRRRLIRDASLLVGGAVAAGALSPVGASASTIQRKAPVISLRPIQATPVASPAPVDLDTYAPVNLTDAELTTLKAALDRIIPADDLGASANEAGVFVYIDRALGGSRAGALSVLQGGLKALDTAAGSGGFAGLDADKQDELLTTAEGGTLAGDPGGFFATLNQLTREGMFSDPIHGGNVDFAGWDLMGYPGVKLVWTAEDQAVNSTPAPEHVSVAQYGGVA
jgi:hypothetical protein